MERVEAQTHATVLRWLAQGRRVAAATLVEVDGSAPLPLGATLWVAEDGRVEGSVTGGCVEAALVQEATRALTGAAPAVHAFGVSDDLAGTAGLTCGGTVGVHVGALDDDDAGAVREALAGAASGRGAALATVLAGPWAGRRLGVTAETTAGGLGGPAAFDLTVAGDARALMANGGSMLRRYPPPAGCAESVVPVFVQAFPGSAQIVVVGAGDFAAALAALAAPFGYEVTICDPRIAFAAGERYAAAARVVCAWPDEYLAGRTLGPRDAVLVLSHDPKLDEPALVAALGSGAGYVGALGSRRTQAQRRVRLLAAGVPEDALRRMAGPCGLDIGPQTATETALSILAEIVALRAGRRGDRLTATTGDIRSPVAAVPMPARAA